MSADLLRKRLTDLLLAVAGERVCLLGCEVVEDIEKSLARGLLFGRTHKRMPGAQSKCHMNSALCWEANKANSLIATGFALSSDGIWREHTWVVVARRPGAKPSNPKAWWTVETTTPRTRYFGYILTPEECEVFAGENT